MIEDTLHLLKKLREDKDTKEDLSKLNHLFSFNNLKELDHLFEEDWKMAEGNKIPETVSKSILEALNEREKSFFPDFSGQKPLTLAIGAGAILVLLFLAINQFFGFQFFKPALIEKANTSSAAQEIQLQDGTKIILNQSSKVKYRESSTGSSFRDIWLEGEAFIEMPENSTNPVRIFTKEIKVEASGNAFNINAYEENKYVSVSVFSGKITVSPVKKIENQSSRWYVAEGENIRYIKKGNAPLVHPFDSIYVKAWMDNRLAFDNESLETAFYKLQRYFHKPFEFDPNAVMHCEGNEIFDADVKLDEVLKKLLRNRRLSYKIHDDKVVITGKGCS